MESQPQNPEFRNNPESFNPLIPTFLDINLDLLRLIIKRWGGGRL